MVSIKWRGTNEERKSVDDYWKKCAENVDGCDYKGLYSSWQTDYNWADVFDVEDAGKFQKAMMSVEMDRDYTKLPAIVVEMWGGPF